MAPKRESGKLVAENRKARFNYDIEEKLEAGIVLIGSEVKSLRSGKANITESYASTEDGELYLINAHIAEYTQAGRANHDTDTAAQVARPPPRDWAVSSVPSSGRA